MAAKKKKEGKTLAEVFSAPDQQIYALTAEVARLREQLSSAQTQLTKERQDIGRLKGDLDQGGSVFVYAGHSYSQKQVEADLARRFDRYKTKELTAEKLRKILAAREAGLVAASEKL